MENLRGAMLMVFAMGCFAIEDALIKALSGAIPVGQILTITCLGGTLFFLATFIWRGVALWQPEYLDSKVVMRTLCDTAGSICFVSALSLIPLTTASAVIQATPLVVAMGAAIFLSQPVGWRRWLAIIVGFTGVLIIIRPGTEGFSSATLLAVAGMLGLAARDLLTRGLNVSLSGAQLATHTFTAVAFGGVILCAVQGQSFVWPNPMQWGILLGCIGFGIVAYLAIVGATRHGNAGIISSFRYSRMIFALIIGYIAFREIPDTATIIGASVIIASGLFTLFREARLMRASPTPNLAL